MDVPQTVINSALAGIITKSILAPIDRIKILFQTNKHDHFNWKKGIRRGVYLVNTQGAASLWRGNSIQVLRSGPYTAAGYTSRKYLKESLSDNDGNIGTFNGFLVGAIAAGISSGIVYPLDTLRACMATEMTATSSISNVWRQIVKKNGVGSLYKGFFVNALGIIPYGSLGWGGFYILNRNLQKLSPSKEESIPLRTLAIFSSVCFAQTVVYPIDVWRRRIQNNVKSERVSNIRIFRQIMTEKAFFRGVTINWLKTPCASTLAFTLFTFLEELTGNE